MSVPRHTAGGNWGDAGGLPPGVAVGVSNGDKVVPFAVEEENELSVRKGGHGHAQVSY